MHRRIAYYGNAAVDDVIRTQVTLFAHRSDPARLGVRYVIQRDTDDRVICRSEAIKMLPRSDAAWA